MLLQHPREGNLFICVKDRPASVALLAVVCTPRQASLPHSIVVVWRVGRGVAILAQNLVSDQVWDLSETDWSVLLQGLFSSEGSDSSRSLVADLTPWVILNFSKHAKYVSRLGMLALADPISPLFLIFQPLNPKLYTSFSFPCSRCSPQLTQVEPLLFDPTS